MTQPVAIALVAAGGALGAVLRYLLTAAIGAPGRFPLGTLTVNLLGSFAIGALLATAIRDAPAWRLFLVTGLLGGFTTYSAFNEELLELLRTGETRRALLAATTTLVGGLLAGTLGWWVIRRLA